jgi:hypothetical protein
MRCGVWSRHRLLAFLVPGLLLLAPRAGWSDALTHYTVQVLAQIGQPTGDFAPQGAFSVGQLNDSGQLALLTGLAQGGALVQYSGGKFVTIAVAQGPAPGGKTWPKDMGIIFPSMNEAGNIAFQPIRMAGNPLGTYLWDSKSQTVIPVATPGMPAADNRNFVAGGDHGGATINNRDEIAFVGFVKNSSNQTRAGIFVRRADGQVQGVALPDAPLPGGQGKVLDSGDPYLNDAGMVAFVAFGIPGARNNSYVWENGEIRVICEAGTEIPDFGVADGAINFGGITNDGSVLFGTRSQGGPQGLFLGKKGQIIPVLAHGQEMPDGGKYLDQQITDWGPPSGAGHFPFQVQINENGVTRTAVYLVDGEGRLSLVLKSGMATDLGMITGIGSRSSFGLSVNSKGQVALTAQINNGPDTLLLLTPVSP